MTHECAALLVAAAIGAAGIAAAVEPQTSSSEPGTVSGRVVSADTGEALANVRVTIAPATPDTPIVLTGSDGRFTIHTPPGSHAIVASKTGYARQETRAISDGPLEIRLTRGGVVSGRLIDEFGDPAIGVPVTARPAAAHSAPAPPASVTTTNDLGEYRLFSLPADSYVVASIARVGTVVFAGERPAPPAQIYYPGTSTRADAHAVRVDAGEEVSGIDFAVPAPPSPLLGPLVETAEPSNPSATGSISGRIVTTDGRALPTASVVLRMPIEPRRAFLTTRSGADGRYQFTNLTGGEFYVLASKPGYLGVAARGQTTFGFVETLSQRAVTIRDGEARNDLDVSLARSATVSGQVFDDLGDPLERTRVQLLHVRYEAGRRRLVPAGAPASTDDRGRYRLFGIGPGQYVVAVSASEVGSAQLPSYARSYFPGTTDPSEAQFVSLGPSQELAGIDVPLARTRTFTVAGRLIDSSGQPTTGGTLQLLPSQRAAAVSVPAGAQIGADGAFAFPNLPAGQYVVRADRGRRNPSTEGEFGTLPVAVSNEDVRGLVLRTSAGSSIKGRIVFERFNDSKPPALSSIQIAPVPVNFDLAPPSTATADIHDDWTFELAGINGARRLQVLHAPAEWALKEVRAHGISATDRPLSFGRADQSLDDVEIVLTDRVARLAGAVTDDRARAAAGAHVIVFATDRDRWYSGSRFLQIVVAGSDGGFAVTALPPGSYYAVAVESLPGEGDDSWQDAAYLESLAARAASVILADGETRTVKLEMKNSK